MKSVTKPRWILIWSAGVALMMVMLALFGDGGKALAATMAMLLSGSSSQGTRLDGIEVLSWSHDVKAPRDVATGQSSGKRQYQPLLIRKRIDKASPLLYRAMGRDETFGTLRFNINEQGNNKASGMTVTLTDAKVIEIATGDVNGDGITEESVSFTFAKIEWSADGVTYQDTWSPSPPSTATGDSYRMAIKENGLPGNPKKETKVTSYRTQIISPRDAASGLPTGKRMHKPFVVVASSSSDTPELTGYLLSGKSLESVTVTTYGADGQPTGAINLLGVQVVSMTDTRGTSVIPSTDMPRRSDTSMGSSPPDEPRLSAPGTSVVYELVYQKIQWLNATGGVTHEDTWDSQR